MATAPKPATATHSHPPAGVPSKIYIVSYPKVVFLYPTFIAAIVAGLYHLWFPGHHELVATLFLAILAVNIVVFSFDFPRTTSLTLFFFIAMIVLGALLLFKFNEQILPFLHGVLKNFNPSANETFYFTIAGILGAIFVVVYLGRQFDYWEATPNELLHHHGFLSDLKRYSAPNMKIDKEIVDVFEYILLGSGRLILHPSNEPRAIVLDNVLFINRKEAVLTRMLSALQVKVVSAKQSE